MKKQISTSAAPEAIGPYSQGVEAGGLLFLSGQIPVNPSSGAIPEGIAAQTAQCLDNVSALLAEAGMGLSDVVKTTVYLSDMSLLEGMNAVYAERFAAPFPARSTVAVRELPKKALVEIEVIARR